MSELNLNQSLTVVQVLGFSLPDPDLIAVADEKEFPALIDYFIKAKNVLELETLKIKNIEIKLKAHKDSIKAYDEKIAENLVVRMKVLKKSKTPDGFVIALKVNSSVEIIDIEKLPGACTKLVKTADKTITKTMIELGEIRADAAKMVSSFSVTITKPKEK